MIQYTKGQFVDVIARPVERLEVPLPSCWYVLRTHPGKERKVLTSLRREDVNFYFPTFPREETVVRRRYGYEVKVKRTVTTPLFPGMIFVPDFECERVNLAVVEGCSGFLWFGDWKAYLKPTAIADIVAINAVANVPRSKREAMFKAGQLVRIVDGPFASFNGRIERLDSKGRLSVLVDLFKRMTPVMFEAGQLEPV
ncbi:MAG: hypothetical protein J0H51_13065 [Rhizobiales bacterium]|nr:hypothetical protein [Hyphomicrobiales bacterium]